MASMRSAFSNAATNSRRPNSPLPSLLLGFALLVFWVLTSLLQIQTSEAFILNGPAVTFVPNWSILKQPLDLIQGHLTPDMAKATVWGWGIELVYLVCILGYEVAHEGVRSTNRHLAGWFSTGAFVLIAFCAYTDFLYGNLASGFWGQVGFSLITSFVVAFFGIIGLHLIEHGLTEWTR